MLSTRLEACFCLFLFCSSILGQDAAGLPEYPGNKETQLQGIKGSCKQLNSNKTLTAQWPSARTRHASKRNNYGAAPKDKFRVYILTDSCFKLWSVLVFKSCWSKLVNFSLCLCTIGHAAQTWLRMSHGSVCYHRPLLKLHRGQLLSLAIVLCSVRLTPKCLRCVPSQ